MKTLALRARVLIHCFLVFGYPGETLALVVHILHEIRYIISFQFKVKPASEEDTLLKLCVIDIVCTILKKNMQVGCHISVVLKDQLILKIVYDKNLS